MPCVMKLPTPSKEIADSNDRTEAVTVALARGIIHLD